MKGERGELSASVVSSFHFHVESNCSCIGITHMPFVPELWVDKTVQNFT